MSGEINPFETKPTPKREYEKYFILIRWLLTKFIVLTSFFVFGQLHQDGRVELAVSSEHEAFEIATAKQYGLILFRRVGNIHSEHLEVIHMDTSFQEKWKGFLPLDKKFYYTKYASSREKIYLLFYNSDFSDRGFQLYEINLATGTFIKYPVRNSIPFLPIFFESTSHGVLIGGYFSRVPVVLFFEFNTQKSKILPGLFNETGELTHIKINPDETFDLLISAKNYQKQQTIWIKNYDHLGGLIRNTMLQSESPKNLIFGRTIQTNTKAQLVAGVYSGKNSEYSRGVFIASISPDGQQQIRYYNFAELEHFFNYMRAGQERRIKDRIRRKEIKGKSAKFLYRFLVHELVSYKDQFILLGEAFQPRYKYVDRGYMAGGFRSLQNPYIFDGYHYTHAVVIGFEPAGNLLWDNSFEINDVKTFSLDQFVKIDVQKNEIALLYLFNNKIRTKIILNNSVLEGKKLNQLQTKPDENISVDTQSNINKLDYWYRDYFLAYGVQTLLSPQSAERKRTKVFFINKLHYQ